MVVLWYFSLLSIDDLVPFILINDYQSYFKGNSISQARIIFENSAISFYGIKCGLFDYEWYYCIIYR